MRRPEPGTRTRQEIGLPYRAERSGGVVNDYPDERLPGDGHLCGSRPVSLLLSRRQTRWYGFARVA
jgi:hypothetical protein